MNALLIKKYRLRRYSTKRQDANLLEVNNVIYNEKTSITATFKDFLIKDDLSEFLKRSVPNKLLYQPRDEKATTQNIGLL